MNCWHCRSEIIWHGDHDISEEDAAYDIMTELSCPECRAITIVYYPKEEKNNGSVSTVSTVYTQE